MLQCKYRATHLFLSSQVDYQSNTGDRGIVCLIIIKVQFIVVSQNGLQLSFNNRTHTWEYSESFTAYSGIDYISASPFNNHTQVSKRNIAEITTDAFRKYVGESDAC